MENTKRTGPVWVVAEMKDNSVNTVSLQLVGKARLLADKMGVQVEVVLLGENLENPANLLISSGADTVIICSAPEVRIYQSDIYSEIIAGLAKAHNPEILLLGSTFMGRELAPTLAAKLGTGLTAHCIDLVLGEDNVLDQKIPAYGGLISILCPEKRPQMATVAGGVFPTPEPDPTRSGTRIAVAVPENLVNRARVVEIVKELNNEQSIEEAQFIVAGGIGTVDVEGWGRLKELANALNAALGCTRPVVDEGWADLETMIGQSGKMVSPQFYLGAGLSGELQHMVGIKGAQIMIAINNDRKSPVFEQVDYGIVEDCKTFIPLLLEKVIEAKRITNCIGVFSS